MTAFPFDLAKKFLPDGARVVLDCGSFNGEDAILFARTWRNASVHAFEADIECFADLMDSLSFFNAGIEARLCAVSNIDGEVDFHSVDDIHQNGIGMSGSILAPTEKLKKDAPNLSFRSVEKVEAIRLDTYCRQNGIKEIDLCHIDVQGAELKVLQGLGDIRPKLIFLETNETAEHGHYEGASTYAELAEWFVSNGYMNQWAQGGDELWVLNA